MTRRARLVAVLMPALFAGACGGPTRHPVAGTSAVSESTTADSSGPGLTLLPTDGNGVLDAVRSPGARATIVNVWATWCVPCREEFPALLALERRYRSRGLRLVLVSVDLDSADARRFLVDQRVDLPTYFKTGSDPAFIDTLARDWSGALPATFVYDASGRRVQWWEGRAADSTFERAALSALNQP